METKEKRLTLESTITHVRDFHNAFGIENASQITAKLSEQDYMLRHDLMKEENDEYIEACRNNDLVEIADALGDQLYILCGTILKNGLENKIEETNKEVSKLNRMFSQMMKAMILQADSEKKENKD